MIDGKTALHQFLPRLHEAEWVALDTEADSLHSYPEKLCLLQIGVPGADVLIDTLADFDMTPLFDALQPRELIMHGADYDLRLLQRAHNFIPSAIFDTMLAERFLGGKHFGLTDLVAKYLGVSLEKGPQKANWSRRPLTDRMSVYARNDTHYLRPLAEIQRGQLEQKGRLSWHREACAQQVIHSTLPRQTVSEPNWRVKGSERLSRKSLAVLREIWLWREQEARDANKPPYFVLSHEVLVQLADCAPMRDASHLLPEHLTHRRKTGLLEAVQRGLQTSDHHLPAIPKIPHRRLSDAAHRRLDELKRRRDRHAAELGLDPSFVASRATLVELAEDWAANSGELMAWQLKLLRND